MVSAFIENSVLPTLVSAVVVACLLAIFALFGTSFLAGELPDLTYVGLLLIPVALWLLAPRLRRFVARY